MSNTPTLALSTLIIGLMACQVTWAGTVTVHRGNIGYDTAAECEAAVAAGTAKSYQPLTRSKPRLRKGETRVRVVPLKDVTITLAAASAMNFQTNDYIRGSCDLGMGRMGSQEGVSKPMQGKYVYYAPETPVNVYYNQQGQPVRATMQQCDHRFASNFPRPIPGETIASTPVSTTTTPTPSVLVQPNAPIAPPTVTPAASQAASGVAGATATAPATVVSGVAGATATAPATVEAGVLLAAGPLAFQQVLGILGLVAAGSAVLLNSSGETGTTGTTGTN
jgi:hypothetical protein